MLCYVSHYHKLPCLQSTHKKENLKNQASKVIKNKTEHESSTFLYPFCLNVHWQAGGLRTFPV